MTASEILSQARAALLQRFGHHDFRPGQAAIIEAVLAGRDVLAVMPTGSGKSLCYQLPAVFRDGCTLVISPLIALMKDQVDSLQAQGVAATYINSSLSPQEQHERLRACRAGAYDLLYVAPERFRSQRFVEAVSGTRVSLFAIDEAHCISEWGHDFRPDYLRLRDAVALPSRPQVLALTATATVDVQRDIVQQLARPDMHSFVYGFDRANLVYRVVPLNGQAAKLKALHQLLATQPDGSTIVYTSTRRAAEEIAGVLKERGAEVLLYHAGLSDAARKRAQDAFMERPNALIVATNAFGMGIDKPDVRYVVHFNLPRSLEAYYQEAGRAGRDGGEAHCVLLFSYGDVRIQEFLVEHNNPTREVLEHVYELLSAMGSPGTEIQLSSLLGRLGPGGSAMQLTAASRCLEKAGYVEQLTNFAAGDETAAGMAKASVRLTGERLAPHKLVLDDDALRRRATRTGKDPPHGRLCQRPSVPAPEDTGILRRGLAQDELQRLRPLPAGNIFIWFRKISGSRSFRGRVAECPKDIELRGADAGSLWPHSSDPGPARFESQGHSQHAPVAAVDVRHLEGLAARNDQCLPGGVDSRRLYRHRGRRIPETADY